MSKKASLLTLGAWNETRNNAQVASKTVLFSSVRHHQPITSNDHSHVSRRVTQAISAENYAHAIMHTSLATCHPGIQNHASLRPAAALSGTPGGAPVLSLPTSLKTPSPEPRVPTDSSLRRGVVLGDGEVVGLGQRLVAAVGDHHVLHWLVAAVRLALLNLTNDILRRRTERSHEHSASRSKEKAG